MGKKLTKKERNSILYDVGNSAFTLLIATILPIDFYGGDFNRCDWLRIAWSGKGLDVVSGYLHYCKSRIFKQPDFL